MKKFLDRSANAILTIFLIGFAFYIGFEQGKESIPPKELVTGVSNLESGMPDGVDFSSFWKAWNIIDEKFAPEATTTSATSTLATNEKRIWGAISGMVDSLGDPHTLFMPPEQSARFETEISGSFEGIGMEIAVKDGLLTVVAPLKNTPAEKAGILPGDVILKINDTLTTNMKAEQAVKIIRGKSGTAVKLLLERKGAKKNPIEVDVVRDTIQIPTIDTEFKFKINTSDLANGTSTSSNLPIKDGVFIIRFYSFSAPSPSIFRDALRQFVESGSKKLIIDLRGNPGGFLDAAIDITSWFVPPGKIIVRENFGEKEDERIYRSKGYGNGLFDDIKVIILVDEGSASASEIMAGAMQEYGKALLVGTNTFGKGSVQELLKITPETSLKVTIARWLTPNGRSISNGGLKPDYEVKITEENRAKGKDPQMDKAIEILNKI